MGTLVRLIKASLTYIIFLNYLACGHPMGDILCDTARSSFTCSKGLTRADFPTAGLSVSRKGLLEDSGGRPAEDKPVNAGNRPGQAWRYLPGLYQSNPPRTRFLPLKGVGKAKSETQGRSGGSGLAPNVTPRGKPTSGTHQRPAFGSELPISYSRSEITPRRKSPTRYTWPANESDKLGELAMTNQELKTSLRKKWEAIIGNDSQISDVLRGTAVNEFLPFLSNTYLYHRGIDLKNGKLTQETDKLDILFNKFRNRVIGSKRYSRKGSDHHGTPTTYDVLMSDLMKSVIEVIESLDLDNINKETNFEQKYNIFLRNQLHQNENFLQGIKHKFEKATKAQQEELKKACAGIQSELQQVARDMGDEEKHFALAIFGRLDPSFRAEFDILLRRLVFIAKRDQKYYLKMKTIPKDSNGLASQRVRCKALHALLELIDSVEGVESAGQLINYTSISKIFSPGELEELFTKLASLRLEDILSQFRLISKDELDWLEMGDKPPLHAIANQNSSNFPSMKNLHKELVEKLEAIN